MAVYHATVRRSSAPVALFLPESVGRDREIEGLIEPLATGEHQRGDADQVAVSVEQDTTGRTRRDGRGRLHVVEATVVTTARDDAVRQGELETDGRAERVDFFAD